MDCSAVWFIFLVMLAQFTKYGGAFYDTQQHIDSTRLFGNIDAYAYYFVDLMVGTPAQRVSVILDTGSNLAAFPCARCDHCGQHIDPAFDISQSSTASIVPCGLSCRDACKHDRCEYEEEYTEGSSIKGFYFEDMVSFMGDNPPVRSRIGCHYNENKLFYNQKANGILGVGPHAKTLFRDLFADRQHIRSSVFALCLAEWGGRLVVGGFNSSYHTGPMQYMPLDTKGGYYASFRGMIVAEQTVFSQPIRALLDSGTTYVYMPTTAYRALRMGIEEYCIHHGCGHASLQGECWDIPGLYNGLSAFPNITLNFEDALMTWVPASYLYRRGASSLWCNTFKDDGPDAEFTLGAAWMLNHEVMFDMDAGRVGFAPAICPEYHLSSSNPSASTHDSGISGVGGIASSLMLVLLPATLVWISCYVLRHCGSSKFLHDDSCLEVTVYTRSYD